MTWAGIPFRLTRSFAIKGQIAALAAYLIGSVIAWWRPTSGQIFKAENRQCFTVSMATAAITNQTPLSDSGRSADGKRDSSVALPSGVPSCSRVASDC